MAQAIALRKATAIRLGAKRTIAPSSVPPQCESSLHSTHVFVSGLQTGVVPTHWPCCVGVHCTQTHGSCVVPVQLPPWLSHTGVVGVPTHCALVVHLMPTSSAQVPAARPAPAPAAQVPERQFEARQHTPSVQYGASHDAG